MLANPHWNAPSVESFESWLETKDPQQTYPYSDCQNCACAQYLKHVGKYEDKWLSKSTVGMIMHELNGYAAGDQFNGQGPDYTFGGCLTRVRAARKMKLAVVA